MELKGLDTALKLLGQFTAAHPQWGVRDLSQHAGLSPSAVQRMLATFEQNGFLQQCPQTRRYRLGVRVWELGAVFRDQFELGDRVMALLQEAAEQSGETVFLTLRDGDMAVCVQKVESPATVKVAIRLGERTALTAGSRGKVMLAFLDEARRAAIVGAICAGDASGRDKMEQDLAQIRAQRWCCTRGERLAEVVGLSVPLFDRQASVFASATIGGPASRMSEARVQVCLPVLLRLGQDLQSHFNTFQ